MVINRSDQRAERGGRWQAGDVLPPTGLRENFQHRDQKLEDGGLIKGRQ